MKYRWQTFVVGIVAALVAAIPAMALAQAMTSSSYQLQFDSANSGGGFASSSSYSLEDTIGEVATGRSGSGPSNWFDTDWDYRIKVTVNAAQVSSTLSSFPLYVDLSDMPADFFQHVASDGADIRVTESNGTTETPFEVVAIDTANESGELHVLIDSLSSSSDTDFYIYYDNPSASAYADNATYGAENVWDGDYVLVSHNTDITTSSVEDSTSNGFDGTKTSANNPLETDTGQVGQAQEFTVGGTNDISHGNFGAITSFTASAWVNADTMTGSGDYNTYGYTVFASSLNGTARYPLWMTLRQGEIRLWAFESDPTGGYHETSNAGMATDTWYHITATAVSGSSTKVFLDGDEILSFTNDADVGWSTIFTVGDLRPARGINFDGEIDEVRFSSAVRSNDWIQMEYFNHKFPNVLYTVHDEESQYGTYLLGAGYQQMNETYLSISVINDVLLEPGVGVVTDNSVGNETLLVRTDNDAGYNMTIRTTQTPALQHISSGGSFGDYTPVTPSTPESWSVDAGQSEFGFSAYDYAGDVADGTWGDKDDCGNTTTGQPDTAGGSEQLYDGLSTSARAVASRNSRTSNIGSAVTLCFAAGTNDGLVEAGEYVAPIVVTVVAL